MDDNDNWDIQKIRNVGGMMGAGIVGGMNLISAYKDGYAIGDGEMVYLGFGAGFE